MTAASTAAASAGTLRPMQSRATTVEQYLASLPDDRRAAIEAVRKVILKNLDADYEEGMQYGMIGYYVPHRVFPAGYHADPRKPLPFAALASQKSHMALYLMSVYGDDGQEAWLRQAWEKTGQRLDMGKSCVRFKKLDDLPLEVVGEAIRRSPVASFVARYKAVVAQAIKGSRKGAASAKVQAKKTKVRGSGDQGARPASRKK